MIGEICLLIFGAAVFIHLICMANFFPEKGFPFVWVFICLGVSFAVLILHSLVFNELLTALWASLACGICLIMLNLAIWLNGYHVSTFLKSKEFVK